MESRSPPRSSRYIKAGKVVKQLSAVLKVPYPSHHPLPKGLAAILYHRKHQRPL